MQNKFHYRAIMRNQRLFSLLLLTALLALTGCQWDRVNSPISAPGKVEELLPARTNVVTVLTTNTVVITKTNEVGAIVGQAFTVTITTNLATVISPPVYFTNATLSPMVAGGINTADTLASAAGVPWAHTAATALSGALAIGLAFLNAKARKRELATAQAHEETKGVLATAQTAVETLVDNFESVRKVALTVPGYTPELDHKVMDGVKIAQLLAGSEVKGLIGNIVDTKTDDTIPNK